MHSELACGVRWNDPAFSITWPFDPVTMSDRDASPHVTRHAADLRDPAQAVSLIDAVRPTHLLHGTWLATPHVYDRSPENADWLQAMRWRGRSAELAESGSWE